ncbi:heat shock 70, partial [Blastocystis sp. ATCC 50177/Nand II]
KFKAEDEANKARIEAKNSLENYTFTVRNSLRDEAVSSKLAEADKKAIESKIDAAVSWLDDHPNAEKEEYEQKQKELEAAIMPIFSKMAGNAPAGGMPGGKVVAQTPEMAQTPERPLSSFSPIFMWIGISVRNMFIQSNVLESSRIFQNE